MKWAEAFESIDEPFQSPDLARAALLLTVPGARTGRSLDIAARLTAAARLGVDEYHRDRAAHEYFTYLKKIQAVVKDLPPPQFSDPDLPAEDSPSDLWKARDEYEASARRYFDLVRSTVQAQMRVVEKFGDRAVARLFEKPRERMKFYMVRAVLRDAFDEGYPPPTPAEIALLAVVHGVDAPMRSPHDSDNSDQRRKRWQYTLGVAKRLFDEEIGVTPPSSGA